MHDPMEHLRTSAGKQDVPPPNLADVVKRGRALRVRRRTGAGFLSLALVAAGSFATSTVLGERVDKPDVFQTTENDSTVEVKAKVATFAFHALLNAGDYVWDYRDVERVDGGWKAVFVDGSKIDDLSIDSQDPIAALTEQEQELRELFETLEEEAKSPSNDKKSNRVINKQMDGVRQELEENSEKLSDLLEIDKRVGSKDAQEISLTIVERSGRFVVGEVAGPMSDAVRSGVLAYSEAVPASTGGYEFFNLDMDTSDPDEVTISARSFWTGEVPWKYHETCRFSVEGSDGTVENVGDHDGFEMTGPRREERRDGTKLSVGIGVRKDATIDDLTPVVDCSPESGD